MCHIQCQTDPVYITEMDSDTMVQLLKVARPSQVAADHSYTTTMQACDTRQVLDLPNELMTSSPIKHRQDLGGSLTSPRVSLDHNISASSFCDLDDMDRAADISWHPSDRDNVSGSSDYEDEPLSYNLEYDVSNNNIVEETKILVFANHLDKLVHCTTCQVCNSPMNVVTKVVTGTNRTYNIQYLCNHDHFIWSTQPQIGNGKNKMYAGNLLVCSAILYSGSTYSKMYSFCKLLNMLYVSESTYYDIQANILLPVISERYNKETLAVYEEITNSRHDFIMAGDGKYDSPGFSAKYCA